MDHMREEIDDMKQNLISLGTTSLGPGDFPLGVEQTADMLKRIITNWYFWNFSLSEQCSGRCVEECESDWIRSAGNFDIWYYHMALFIFFTSSVTRTNATSWAKQKSLGGMGKSLAGDIINLITFFCWVKVPPDTKEATLPQWGARVSTNFWLISKPGCTSWRSMSFLILIIADVGWGKRWRSRRHLEVRRVKK